MIEKQVNLVAGQVNHLEAQKFSMENAAMIQGSVQAMMEGNRAMQQQGLDIDQLQDDMDEVVEMHQQVEEMGNLFTEPVYGQDLDDAELLEEFEQEMEEDALEEGVNEAVGDATEDVSFDLPDAPTSELTQPEKEPAKANQEDAELADLAAW